MGISTKIIVWNYINDLDSMVKSKLSKLSDDANPEILQMVRGDQIQESQEFLKSLAEKWQLQFNIEK